MKKSKLAPQMAKLYHASMIKNPTKTASAHLLRVIRQHDPRAIDRAQEDINRKEFTIDQLANEADVTVRNIRAYQDRGLLLPPEKRGRTGIYTDVHLARLKIINALLERGYTINNIRDLLEGWEQGRNLNDILGLEVAVTSWQSPNVPVYISYHDVLNDFGADTTPAVITKAVSMGYMVPEGTRLRIPYPRIYNAGKELVKAGVPLDAVLTHVRLVREETDKLADRFLGMIIHHIVDEKYGKEQLPEGEDVPALAEFITRIRPLAEAVVNDELGRVLEKSISKILVDRLENVLDHLKNADH